MDFLPNGDILVAERSGGLRIVRAGVLDPEPISEMPEVHNGFGGRLGLWDVAVHPQFAENRLVYFTYLKPAPSEDAAVFQGVAGTQVLARGRFDGANTLTDVEDIFVSDAVVSGFSVARLVFAPDGKIFMSIGMPLRDEAHGGSNRIGTAEQSQDPGSHAGKILRLNDDGAAPSDNPFAGDPAYRPEIYALGFRDPLGLIIHPETGELWEVEHGPQGGDALNIVRPGRNYGWPVVSYGRAYTGEATVGTGGTGPELAQPCAPGMEQPLLYSYPVISPGGMALYIYTGDAFPAWKGSLFIGGMSTTQLQRIVLNQRGTAGASHPAADRAQPADPRREAGTGWPAVRHDGSRGRGGAENRAGRERNGELRTADVALQGERRFRRCRIPARPMQPGDFDRVAVLYRQYRRRGETVRVLMDCPIGALAVRADLPVLHCDGDFDALARYTPLRVDVT